MSIYGEGQYRNPRTGESGIAPWLRPETQLAAREWDVLGEDGAALEPQPTSETKPLRPTSIYAINKRDHEEMFLAIGAAYGVPAVALRFFNVYGERQALSNPYTGVAAIFSSRLLNDRSAPRLRGREPDAGLHRRPRHRALLLPRTLRRRANGRTLNVGTGVPTSIVEVARVIADGLGKEIEPEVRNEYRAGDIRHCYRRYGAGRGASRLPVRDRVRGGDAGAPRVARGPGGGGLG